ncbi:SGNH/GDSL hydrolase family protein [Microbacterium sp. NPDC058342]|uniref:SGNH/GDSL hydrolase family protein n=1 Tax=Microbacterium sp. NPDC058342 TaxID=3346454 RepID=UPI00364D2EA2
MADDGSERAALAARLAGGAALSWVLTGDSITHGMAHTLGARSYPEHLHELVRTDLGRTRDAFINTGVAGHQLGHILDDWEHRIARWRPDIVLLMIGTNDAMIRDGLPFVEPDGFAASLDGFVRRVRMLGATPILQTPPAVDAVNAPGRDRLPAFVSAVRDAAVRHDVILVDQHARFTELGAGRAAWGLLADPVHPNAAGHAVIAREIAAVLGIEPARSRVLGMLDALIDAASG